MKIFLKHRNGTPKSVSQSPFYGVFTIFNAFLRIVDPSERIRAYSKDKLFRMVNNEETKRSPVLYISR